MQPRLGLTWDARGDGRVVVRGGCGVYVTRNRPWFQLRSMSQFVSSVVRIGDPTLLRNLPGHRAVLGGRTRISFIASGGPRSSAWSSPTISYRRTPSTPRQGWLAARPGNRVRDRLRPLAAETIRSGSTDVNLPEGGALANPASGAAIRSSGDARKLHEELVRRARGAVRNSRRGAGISWQVSYTLSRSYLDGVDFFVTRFAAPSGRRTNAVITRSISDTISTMPARRLLPWWIEAAWS